jgi:hypothetical protein
MAATTSVTKQGVWGDTKYGIVEVTLDSSYPTGGEAIDFPAALGWNSLTGLVSVNSTSATGYVPQWDSGNAKMLMYEAGADAAALDEVANTTDLSAETMTCLVIGV